MPRHHANHEQAASAQDPAPTPGQRGSEQGGTEAPRANKGRWWLAPLRWIRKAASTLLRPIREVTSALLRPIREVTSALLRPIREVTSALLRPIRELARSPFRLAKTVFMATIGKDRGFGFWWLIATLALAVAIGLLIAVVLSPVLGLLAAIVVAIWMLVARSRSDSGEADDSGQPAPAER
jgi:hypothetical protein